MKNPSLFSLAACVLLVFSSEIATAQVPLIVEERAGMARADEPATLGVPFEQGALFPGTPMRITNPSGSLADAQVRPMALWEDGSIKWLKADFQASVGANGTATYALETGAAHVPETPLTHIVGVFTLRTA